MADPQSPIPTPGDLFRASVLAFLATCVFMVGIGGMMQGLHGAISAAFSFAIGATAGWLLRASLPGTGLS